MSEFDSMTVKALIKDPYFQGQVENGLNELKLARIKRPPAKPGFRYKRDWYDQMVSNSTFNKDFFIQNIESIWLRKSNLSSNTRRTITVVCDYAAKKTAEYYKAKEKLIKD